MTQPKFWPESGHFNIDQYRFVKKLLSDKKIEYALEIGFATGRSALSVLNNCKYIKKMISIDIDFDYGGMGGRKILETLEKEFPVFSGIESDSKSIMTDTFFGENYPEGIDYCLVDGDHTYDGCFKDLDLIFPNMKSGGIILIDDYKSGPPNGYNIPEVTRSCDDFYNQNSSLIDKSEWNKNGKGFCIFIKK
jgi:predicted O-methyltransferase YrrM